MGSVQNSCELQPFFNYGAPTLLFVNEHAKDAFFAKGAVHAASSRHNRDEDRSVGGKGLTDNVLTRASAPPPRYPTTRTNPKF